MSLKLLEDLRAWRKEGARVLGVLEHQLAAVAGEDLVEPRPPAPAPAHASRPPSQPPDAPVPIPALATALDAWPGGRLPPAEFVAMLRPAAEQSERDTGVPAAVTIAQAALETGWGGSSIGDAKNLFGIKGAGPAGSVTVRTGEVIDGQRVTVQAPFRKYHSWQESIDDHAKFLATGPRYAPAMAVRSDPEAFARAIAAAGYATEPEYADELISIIRRYSLARPGAARASAGVTDQQMWEPEQAIRAASLALVGKPFDYAPDTEEGALGCADVASTALIHAGVIAAGELQLSVAGLDQLLRGKYGWTATPAPYQDGDVVNWGPRAGQTHGHVGIVVLEAGKVLVMNNSSSQKVPILTDLATYDRPVVHVLRAPGGSPA